MGHRLPAGVVVDAEEGAGEGHYFSVGDEYTGVNLSRRDGDEGGTKQGDAEEAEQGGDDELEGCLRVIR